MNCISALMMMITLGGSMSGCGVPASSNGSGATVYNNMIPYYATSLVSTAESMCVMANSRAASAMLAGSMIDGATPMADYKLEGGTATVTAGAGHISLLGTGMVNVSPGFSGTLTVCGPSIGNIAGARGMYANIFVQNGVVNSIQNFAGTLAIKNGAVMGTIVSSKANIAWELGGSTLGRTYTGD